MKTSLTIFIMILSFLTLHAQFHLGTYSFVAVGIGGPIANYIDLEGKLFANERITDMHFEGCVMFNIRPGSFHQISAGIGFNANFLSDDSFLQVVFPVELEIYPLTSFRRLSLLIELAPDFFVADDELFLRHMWGIRYYFKEPKNY